MIRTLLFVLALGMALALVPFSSFAVNPDEVLDDPVLEQRARDISKGLRCLVCQNQSIDDSDATLAKDLRVLVRERLSAGDSNEAVVSYVVSRYGDFVLLKPPFNISTLVLWLGPILLVLLGLFGIYRYFRKNRAMPGEPPAQVTPLSEDEQQRLDQLLKEGGT